MGPLMIQLQYNNSEGENIGGVYFNVDHIVTVWAAKVKGDYETRVQTTDGTVWNVVHSVSEVLDKIQECLELRKQLNKGL